MDTYTLFETVGVVVCGLAVGGSLFALSDAVRTVRSVAAAQVTNGRRTVAVGQVVGEFLRLLKALALTASVGISWWLPSPPPVMPPEVLVTIMARKMVLLSVGVLILFGTLWDLHVRYLLRRRH